MLLFLSVSHLSLRITSHIQQNIYTICFLLALIGYRCIKPVACNPLSTI